MQPRFQRTLANRRLGYHSGLRHSFENNHLPSHDDRLRTIASMVRNLSPEQHSMSFRTYIQSIAFTSVLIGFLGATLSELDPEDVAFVTSMLDQLCTRAPARPEQLQRVHSILRQWLHERYEDPLDYIMPAYETIWSVVASTVAMVYDQDDYKSAFLDFGENPTPRQFEAPRQGGRMPSAEAVVMEMLRMHPPNRQIYRETLLVSWPFTVSVVRIADINVAQRSRAWGDNSNVFDPSREGLTQGQQSEERPMLAFGHGRLKCLGARWAPIAVGVIVAKVLENL
ncbi:hypothetical protein CONPUDRAFT_80162, partial [Coniophora puteana RWD-64-598 SS2]